MNDLTIFTNGGATNVPGIIEFVACLVAIAAGDVLFFNIIKRRFAVAFTGGLEACFIVCVIFRFNYLAMALGCSFLLGGSAFLITNISDYRTLVSNTMKGKGGLELFKRNQRVKPEPIFDRGEMYQKVEAAVVVLSRQRIGALITFERKDDLTEVMKNGTMLNAPVSSELLQTIFYPGTRLHDGAVIIRNDKIAAASVYYTPTNRPLTGKYGSRHRAAYGICETTDSVTIVVSEETGRISIAFQGELTPVTPDNFLRVFEDDMLTEVTPASESDGEKKQ
jgi:uncharacterized protein (TIGR00159 family)